MTHYLNLDMFGSEIDDGFAYCAECDTCSDFHPVPMNDFYDRWQCQNCGAFGKKLVINDYGYQLQGYLLQSSDHDEGLIQMYDGTWK